MNIVESLGQWLVATWSVVAVMAPWLLVGLLLAGLLHVWLTPAWVQRHLGRPGWRQILKATAFGIPLPICSCGVIPIAAGLRRSGASPGATAAFLASTPQTGIDSIAATGALLGPVFAAVRVMAAAVSGLLAGWLVETASRRADATPTEVSLLATAAASAPKSAATRLRQALTYGLVELPRDLGPTLLVGLLLAGAFGALVAPGQLAQWALPGWAAYLGITLIAIPLYVCSTGAIPLAYALTAAGLSPGTALILLVAGPATNLATITSTWKLLGGRATVLYVGAIVGVAWLFAAVLDLGWLGPAALVGPVACDHETLAWWQHASGALLLGLLAFGAWPRGQRRATSPSPSTTATTSPMTPATAWQIDISDMECPKCARKVTETLQAVTGMQQVEINLEHRRAVARGVGLTEAPLRRPLENAGYTVVAITQLPNA